MYMHEYDIHPREWHLMCVRWARDMRHNIPIAHAVESNDKHEITRRKSCAHVVNATLGHALNACCDTHIWYTHLVRAHPICV